jgi:hypothetical protein
LFIEEPLEERRGRPSTSFYSYEKEGVDARAKPERDEENKTYDFN